MDALLVDLFVEAHDAAPSEIVLDVDATDDPLHGGREGRFFSGHYDCYCYLPLYVFCGGHLLCARLRSASSDAADETVEELERIVSRIRRRWPGVRVVVRGDSGFCREEIMAWCEASAVDYAFGLRRNVRLEGMSAAAMYEARIMHGATGEAQRVFEDLGYAAHSWSRERRVVAKAEHNGFGANPRFVATSVAAGEMDCEELHEGFHCARGDMENRIKGAPGELATVQPMAKRVSRTLKRIKEELRRRRHDRTEVTGRWLGQVPNGWLNHFAVPTSFRYLARFVARLKRLWLRAIRRRSQKDRFGWDDLARMTARYWPKPTIRHPWPSQRLAVNATQGRSRMP